MKNQNEVIQAKKQAKQIIQDSLESRFKKLKRSKSFKELEKQISDFENEIGTNKTHFELDEFGSLNSFKEIDSPLFETEESEMIDFICETLGNHYGVSIYFSKIHNARIVSICHGEPVLISSNPDRNEYKVYSSELGLKIMDHQVKSETHLKLIIERAMRKAGYFPNIVEIDHYGSVIREVSTEFGRISDDSKIEEMILEIESENEEE